MWYNVTQRVGYPDGCCRTAVAILTDGRNRDGVDAFGVVYYRSLQAIAHQRGLAVRLHSRVPFHSHASSVALYHCSHQLQGVAHLDAVGRRERNIRPESGHHIHIVDK